MDIKTLEEKLDKAINDFSDEIRSEYDDYDKTPANYGDIATVARQTFYTLNEFKKEIIEYLKSNS